MVAYAGLCGDITYAYGLFLPAMSQTFHWSRSALSGPYVLFFVIGGLLGPVAGMTIARFGPRKNIIGFNLIAALGLLGLSQTNALWQVYLFFGAMAGLGIAFGEFIPITTVINHWFIRRRSMAMGLFLASGGVGGFVFPPLISTLISDLGWRWAWGYLAGQHLFLTVILGGILIRNRPEDMGQYPDGIPETPGTSCVKSNSPTPSRLPDSGGLDGRRGHADPGPVDDHGLIFNHLVRYQYVDNPPGRLSPGLELLPPGVGYGPGSYARHEHYRRTGLRFSGYEIRRAACSGNVFSDRHQMGIMALILA